jgi:hypothetical protein
MKQHLSSLMKQLLKIYEAASFKLHEAMFKSHVSASFKLHEEIVQDP